MTDDRKLLFVKNSKAGCSSVAHLLFEYSKGIRYEGNIHRHGIGQLNGLSDWQIATEMLNDKNSYKFTTVRHPVNRAVSCFKNYFVDQTNRNYKKYARLFARLEKQFPNSLEGKFDAFLLLVETSFEQDVEHTDPHFRTQFLNTGKGTINYNRIVRLENYEHDIKAVFDEAGCMLPNQGRSLAERKNKTKSINVAPNAQQLRRLERLYAADFEAFGY